MKDESQNPLLELRNSLFTMNPAELDVSPTEALPNVWAVLMETGHGEGAVTLICIAEGTTSLYFPTGGGIVGAGQHVPIRAASEAFLQTADAVLEDLRKATDKAFPKRDHVRFHVLTYQGHFSAEAPEEELGEDYGPLSVLFFAGQAVITQIRLISQRREQEQSSNTKR